VRDLAVALLIFGSIPFILRRPWIGVLVYVWVSAFGPHKWTFGFANTFQFAMVIGLVTIGAMLFGRSNARLTFNATTVLLILLPLWMTVTSIYALEPELAYPRWKEVMKVFLFALVASALIRTRQQVEALLWVLILSVGFYGVKGGIFTLQFDGAYRVYGPTGESYISDNNGISVALVMMIPLMQYLGRTSRHAWTKVGLYSAMVLSGIAVLGSHSRGAFVAIAAICVFMLLKSERKLLAAISMAFLVPVALGLMPDQWTSRMESITSHEQDASVQGRLNTWATLFNLANDRPLIGGGFEPYTKRVFGIYAPDPLDVHSAHSIYFQILGEHGYVGLALFIALGIVAWSMTIGLSRGTRTRGEVAWAGSLARALQISFVGYAVGGLFVNIAYWEVIYFEIIVLSAVHSLIMKRTESNAVGTDSKPIGVLGNANASMKRSSPPLCIPPATDSRRPMK